MITLAIIDHDNHELFIESVDDDVILNKYDGQEENYIIDKYGFNEGDMWSWDYVKNVVQHYGKPGAVKFEELGENYD